MNRLLIFLFILMVPGCVTGCACEELKNDIDMEETEATGYFGVKKVLIAYFSWSGTTQRMAEKIHTFCEGYDFSGKTVVPFCTYAATYRDETLAEIVNSIPVASHVTWEGLTSGNINAQRIQTWIDLINEEWNKGSGILIHMPVD